MEIGKSNKKDNSPASSNNTVAEKTNANNAANDVIDAQVAVPLEVMTAHVVAVSKESPKPSTNKEKPNKKKRNDALLVKQLGKNSRLFTRLIENK